MKFLSECRAGFASVAAALILLASGCSGGSDSVAIVPAAPAAPAAPTTQTCAQLASFTTAAASIGLPTRGATVSSAVPVAPGGTDNSAYGAFCLVSGDIHPIDTSAPNIKFQVALPEAWNGNALMLGGAGFNGTIPSFTSSAALWGASKARLPLGRGYAVFASDSGHQATADVPGGVFASNDEALRNFSGDALKKTRDVAMQLIVARYGSKPGKSYFLGYSKGGGESMIVAQRWPADWDGVIAGAPAWNVTASTMQMLAATQAVATPGAWMNESKRALLFGAALAACDTLDGVADGIISNVRACAAQFDPATAAVGGVALRCPGGTDTGNTCLSDAQLAGIKHANDPLPLLYMLGSGETSLPGFPVYIADNGGGAGNVTQRATMTLLGIFGSVAPAFPVTGAMSSAWNQSDGFTRYVVALDPTLNALNLDLATGGGLAPRFRAVSALDANLADMSPFMNRGGKLLLWHGTADMLVSPRGSEFLYARMKSAMGAEAVDSFVRFYLVPGSQHGPSSVFQPEWDQLAAIEGWVEKGIDPADTLVMMDDGGVPGRTRPMCRYPAFPRYKSSGDANLAVSFGCSMS